MHFFYWFSVKYITNNLNSIGCTKCHGGTKCVGECRDGYYLCKLVYNILMPDIILL